MRLYLRSPFWRIAVPSCAINCASSARIRKQRFGPRSSGKNYRQITPIRSRAAGRKQDIGQLSFDIINCLEIESRGSDSTTERERQRPISTLTLALGSLKSVAGAPVL